MSATIGRPSTYINWLDFGFDPDKPWPDAELRGLEFLYDQPSLKPKWEEFWPTGRGIHNWDAVNWIGTKPDKELMLLEAKAHVEELKSNCSA